MSSFLPADYSVPKGKSRYMKLENGENRFRILSAPILGWEDWVDDKPVRYKMDKKPVKSADTEKPVRHFWAMIVWNYTDKEINILQITQSTVQNGIADLERDRDWGDVAGYDIKVLRKGDKNRTKYEVMAAPHRPVDPMIIQEFNSNRCNLEALFHGENPFMEGQTQFTKMLPSISSDSVPVKEETVSSKDVQELKIMLLQCPEDYQVKMKDILRESAGIERIEDIPPTIYARVKNAVTIKYKEYQEKLKSENAFAMI